MVTTRSGENTDAPHKPRRTKQPAAAHDDGVPSNILEKGLIYFFVRGRVDVEDPEDIDDVARSYIILRPLPSIESDLGGGGKGTSPAGADSCRLLALPKKAFPRSGRERYMAFVEKAGASLSELREQFLKGSEYETRTAGTRHSPAAAPVGEGVYALTSTGRDSHLVYMLTLPEELGKMQRELGLKKRGSFIISTKNPEFPGPSQYRMPAGPKYPKEIQDEFHSLRWPPSRPAHLDFVNAQVLLVGHSSGIGKATEPQPEEAAKGKEDPLEVLEELEEEDAQRMRHLGEDDAAAVFKDLKAFSEVYQKEHVASEM